MKIYLVEWLSGYRNLITGVRPDPEYYDFDELSDEILFGFDEFQLEKINSLKENESVSFENFSQEIKITLSTITEFDHLGDYK